MLAWVQAVKKFPPFEVAGHTERVLGQVAGRLERVEEEQQDRAQREDEQGGEQDVGEWASVP